MPGGEWGRHACPRGSQARPTRRAVSPPLTVSVLLRFVAGRRSGRFTPDALRADRPCPAPRCPTAVFVLRPGHFVTLNGGVFRSTESTARVWAVFEDPNRYAADPQRNRNGLPRHRPNRPARRTEPPGPEPTHPPGHRNRHKPNHTSPTAPPTHPSGNTNVTTTTHPTKGETPQGTGSTSEERARCTRPTGWRTDPPHGGEGAARRPTQGANRAQRGSALGADRRSR